VTKTVAVVGAGVIGLSTAILALEAGYSVTMYSDKSPLETTSMKAAASFKPHQVAYNDLTQKMVETGWEYFARIVAQYPQTSGVHKQIHWETASVQKEQAPYLCAVEDFEILERPHVPGGYAFGWRYQTFFIDTPVFLPWLVQRFTAGGGSLMLLEKGFTELEQLAGLPSDVVFNCTGLGAKELCHDEAMTPVKGQIVIVDPQPQMDWSISADGFYIYPRKYDTVLGGTVEWQINHETVETGAVDLILRGNQRILPHLNRDLVKRTFAGLRPYRAGTIRLESQNVNGKQIIHNYGHGGSGYTLCWGSAHLALELV